MEKQSFFRMLRPYDFVVAALTLLFATLILLSPFVLGKSDGDTLVCITASTQEEYTLSQNAEYVISSNGYTLTLTIENGEAYIKASDCHDRLCEKMGRISKSGESIVCAPAKAVFKITSKKGVEHDATAG